VVLENEEYETWTRGCRESIKLIFIYNEHHKCISKTTLRINQTSKETKQPKKKENFTITYVACSISFIVRL
jgi:hypothetical protein